MPQQFDEALEVSRYVEEEVSLALRVGVSARLHRRRDTEGTLTNKTMCSADRVTPAHTVTGVPDCIACERVADREDARSREVLVEQVACVTGIPSEFLREPPQLLHIGCSRGDHMTTPACLVAIYADRELYWCGAMTHIPNVGDTIRMSDGHQVDVVHRRWRLKSSPPASSTTKHHCPHRT